MSITFWFLSAVGLMALTYLFVKFVIMVGSFILDFAELKELVNRHDKAISELVGRNNRGSVSQ
jgi:hypothetical protein